MATYNLKDSNGNRQKIKAESLFQARVALREINESNRRQPDDGKALAESWRSAEQI